MQLRTINYKLIKRNFIQTGVIALLAIPILVGLANVSCAQAWSPDNSSIAIEGDTVKLVNIDKLMNSDSSGSTIDSIEYPLLGAVKSIAFSSKGTIVAYVTNDGNLMLLTSMGGIPVILEKNVVSPVIWSPDDKMLGCVRSVDKGGLEYRSISIEGGVSAKSVLPFSKISLSSKSISWVPNTDNVILAGGDGSKSDLYLIEQGQVVPLTMNGEVQGFGVSKSGETVRWAQKSKNAHYILMSIYDTNIAKRTATKLDFPDRLAGVNPEPKRSVDSVKYVVFSPDLNRIAFNTTENTHNRTKNVLWGGDIMGHGIQMFGRWEMPVEKGASNPSGKTVFAPSNSNQDGTAKTEKPASLSQNERPPNFSPDGKWLAYLTTDGTRRILSLYNPSGAYHKSAVISK